MKKVVLVLAEREVPIQGVTNSSNIGIKFVGENEKSWVGYTRRGYESFSIGEQDISSHWCVGNKKEYAETALKMGAEVFIFETHQELIKWLKS